jgi:hypothetical protein
LGLILRVTRRGCREDRKEMAERRGGVWLTVGVAFILTFVPGAAGGTATESCARACRYPFATTGDVSVTADGRIRVHPVSIKAAGVPAGGLLNVLHLRLERLIAPNPARGFTLEGNDMLIDPSRLLPDPRVSGKVTAVRINGDRMVQTFGTHPPSGPEGQLRNYMHYTGNVLRFGRLTMNDADLMLIDQDPKAPFEFSPAGYVDQLVAGYSKNAADGMSASTCRT